jgi:putative oligomerization/nucleic acid binding protein
MPGLLRGIARTAAIAGTATAVSNRVSRRQAGRWARHDAQQASYASQAQPVVYAEPPPPAEPAGPGAEDQLTQLEKLADLKERGVLTDEEFAEQKRRILGR